MRDGAIQGFVGGICAEHSVRPFAWTAMRTGEPVLSKILPEAPEGDTDQVMERGSITVLNTCLSGGAVEVFLFARNIERRHSDDHSPPLRAPSDQQTPTSAASCSC